MLTDPVVWRDIWVTLGETFGGFALGTVAALVLGLLLGLYPRVYDYLKPYLVALYTLPKITIGPLLILYFGIGYSMKVVLAAIIAFFFVFYATVDSVRLTDRGLIGVVRVAGANQLDLVRTVFFPSALNGILSGMKIAMPYALQGALFGEILASNRGLGYLIQSSAGTFDVTGVYAGLVLVTVIAVIVDQVFGLIVTRTQVWRGSSTQAMS
jgi:NitT/TauT family transport system permease protein